MEDWADEELVKKAQNGDVDSFMELTHRYQEKIYWMVLSMTGNHLDADDLSQDTFLQAFRSLKCFRGKSSFYTWLYRIAVNLTCNFLKRAKRDRQRSEVDLESLHLEQEGQNVGTSPESLSVQREFRLKLQEAVDSLPLVYRVSFILVEFQGLSHRQASEILKCSENTISWRMHKARKMLQDNLKSFYERGIQ